MSENEERSAARARSYLNVISDTFYYTYECKQPLDNTLRNFFRENKKYGSKDRRFISDSLYAIYRWFGWLKEELPEKPIFPEDCEFFCNFLLKALEWDCCMEDHPVVLYLKKRYSFVNPDTEDLLQLVPEWLIEDLEEEFDEDDIEDEYIVPMQKRPPVWVRLQGKRHDEAIKELTDRLAEPKEHERIENAVKLTGSRLNLVQFVGYRNGAFEIQDLASQCLGVLCAPKEGESWWDVCAGGGGKSLQLADILRKSGKVLSTDIREWKLKEILKRASRARLKNIQTSTLVEGRKQKFDGVLIDAPCSCTGVWRRNPESRWMTSEEDVQEVARTQRQILEESFHTVKPGGKLIYATCSVTRTENELVVKDFLKDHPQFELVPVRHPLTREKTKGIVRINFLPDDCDAMFAAVMVRSC